MHESPTVAVSLRQRAEALLNNGSQCFQEAIAGSTADKQARCLTGTALEQDIGYWSIALVIDPAGHVSTESFLTMLEPSNLRYAETRRPIWLRRRGRVLGVKDGVWETFVPFDSTSFDFIRLDPQGEFYLQHTLEDDMETEIVPKTRLDPHLVLIRVAEAIAVSLAIAKTLGWPEDTTRLGFVFRWTKLKGRELKAWSNHRVHIPNGYRAHGDEVTAFTELALNTPTAAIATYVDQATQNLFALFNGFGMSIRYTEHQTCNWLKDRGFDTR